MKLAPTDLDRQAGKLFLVASGARWWAKSLIGGGLWSIWNPARGYTPHHPDALDTDDMATLGVMLAQVEAEAGVDCVVTHGTSMEPAGDLKWKVRKANGYDLHVLGNIFGATRGAALVAAMTALKKAPAAPA